MVHIIIKTDGAEATVTTQPEAAEAVLPAPSTAPDEALAAAAAAVGALNAGAAPTGATPATGEPPLPPETVEQASVAGGAANAGAAPGIPSEPPPAVVDQEVSDEDVAEEGGE